MLQNNLDELLKNPKSIYLKHIDPQLLRHREHNILLTPGNLFGHAAPKIPQAVNHIVDQHFRGGRAGGHADGFFTV